ncbi:quaternary amine ABC transporter ATP-binding protein [Orenia marismortui]|uniref:Quaternary amine transport ATP-binding protein n=1 Tax=Orenia marismortui TaxID=46469 RepID=A0A4R8GNS3_9FIRM|nr:glycine betaine/L-proline ABC transporter ATP-binding protein [Orenia marismortui]TDX43693.1 glycine betaine/proline transport system ATP-binding protein [Orenia marismortui]
MSKIEVKNLYKIFGKNSQKGVKLLNEGYSKEKVLKETGLTAGVNNVSFEIKSKEIFVIMGLSGSGKSTLLRCLNRLIEPTAGEVRVDGRDLTTLDKNELRQIRREKFGMVFQNFGLFPHRTILENTEFGLEVQNVDEVERREKSKEALAQVGLAGWEDKYPDELSGGMQQRVGLARALAVDPDILLMDEPFSALDPLIKRDMQNKLLDLFEEMDKTIIFITHDLDEALKLGDRIAIMKDGEVVQIGTHEEILTNAKNAYVREFVKDVNRSRLLTAADVMVDPLDLVYTNHQDGPRAAMRKMEHNQISSIFAVGKNREFQGLIRMEETLEAIEDKEEDILELVNEIPTASPEDNMDDLFAKIADLDCPLPVVDESNKLLGLIVKSTVLANLAGEDIV